MMNFKSFAVASVLIFLANFASAQDSLSFDFKDTPFVIAVREIESKTNYFFYYKKAEVEHLQVNVQVSGVPIRKLLELMMQGTDMHYAIDPSNNIFVTRSLIDTSLADEFNVKEVDTKTSVDALHLTAREDVRGNKIHEIGNKSKYQPGSAVTLSGIVKTLEGNAVAGASVQVEKLRVGVATNAAGQYTLTLPSGAHALSVRSIGMKSTSKNIILYSNGFLDVEMQEEVKSLKEVVITADENSTLKTLSMGVEKLNIKTIKYIPTVFGEADVIRAVLTLPGVKSVGEASTGFNVRGGASDQNLILYNDLTIYNPAHFFGFFSAFNPEAVNSVELYKSTIPARYGGRLSSVLQIEGKQGNQEKIKGSAGIGLVTSRLNLEGPIANGKTTFLVGARTTYSNWIFGVLPKNSGLRNNKASFSDVNLNVTHRFNEANDLSVTGYMSKDESNLNTDTTFRYKSKNIALKWHHDFNSSLSAAFSVGLDHYDYSNSYNADTAAAYKLYFSVDQRVFKANFQYTPTANHKIDFGVNSIYYSINPGKLAKGHPLSDIQPITVQQDRALETAVYAEDQYTVSEKLSFNAGLRYSVFNYFGPHDVRVYDPSLPRTATNAIDTISYDKGKIIKTYSGLDFRLSGRFNVTKTFSVKAGYTTTRQFIHKISNTVSISPTDIWKLSDTNIKPQYSQQISLGVYKNLFTGALETSVEGYLKKIDNYLDYKSGARLFANEHIETETFTTKGKAYGVEFMIRKPKGNLNGWVSYTYSRTLLRMDDKHAGETINDGKYYPANYDKPHDFTFVLNEKLNRRFSISINMTYSTGRPVTIPIGVFYYGGEQKTLYGPRNGYRVPDYFRSDISFNIEGNHKIKQLTHNSWTIGVYNVTGRKNPYSIYFMNDGGVVKGYKLSIFGSAIPFVNYNIKF
jgi:hypothetical protein